MGSVELFCEKAVNEMVKSEMMSARGGSTRARQRIVREETYYRRVFREDEVV